MSFESFLAGGIAGTVVDGVLFPIDSLKTRLQSSKGFHASGGFRNIYSGLTPALLGSAPNAALFFFVYDWVKKLPGDHGVDHRTVRQIFVHMASAGCGEIAACLIRVPIEVVKQRCQAQPNVSLSQVVKSLYLEGRMMSFYKGYMTTVYREIPFSLIQFPLWEYLKSRFGSSFSDADSVKPFFGAVSGALSGAVAASVTTPLDVAKTRIMLSNKADYNVYSEAKLIPILRHIYFDQGIKGLFSGLLPRTIWISFGGFIFLGVYDYSLFFLNNR